jgi:hypothetical protein
MSGTPQLPTSGVLRVQVAEDLTVDGGTWHLAMDQQGAPIAHISPPAVPMFQQVVEYLEAKPVPPGGNMRRADEARAATAVCLRWGSYFAVVADPARPPAPNIDEEHVSQIADDEMARMNIEISAALAWWLALAGSDDRRYWELVARALAYLATGPKAVSALQGGDILSGFHDAGDGSRTPPSVACGSTGPGLGDSHQPWDSRHGHRIRAGDESHGSP